MGYRKGAAGWYDPESARADAAPAGDGRDAARPEGDDSLVGRTRDQVRSRLGGKPDLVVRAATQGRCVEQWIYRNGKQTQVVCFTIEAGTSEPRATAYYSEKK